MYDILPERWPLFRHVLDTFTKAAEDAGYGRIVTPVLEDEALFIRSSGKGTDIVDKELYSFEDKGGKRVALRPEGTAGVIRAYIENGMASLPSPIKLYYVAEMFRYDRPQEGRYRQHMQIGAEVAGDPNPSLDAQLIMLLSRVYQRLGIEATLQINSLGDGACRPKYRKALIDFLSSRKADLAEIDRERLSRNPLRVLDSKDSATRAVLAEAPQILNYLCDECGAHFSGVLEYLDDLGVAYEINHTLVRGMDYYTRTVFEFYGAREGAQSALGGGGRYDLLIEEMGGQPTPAVGFGSGVERLILELEKSGGLPEVPRGKGVYVASLGESARLAAFRLIEELLDAGVMTSGAVDRDGIASQLSRADKMGVKYAVIIGQKEVKEGTVLLRDMASGAQETIKMTEIGNELARRFV